MSRIIVAGATGELGLALCEALAADDAELALLGRDRDKLDVLAARLGGAPTGVIDAADLRGCRSAVDAAAAALGGLDALIVTIGVPAFGDAADLPDDINAALVQVNLLAPMALLGAADAHLGEGGALVAVTGMVAETPTAGLAAYSAAKAALSAYLVALRRERRRRGVNVIEARLPHLETGFAQRALHGVPPALSAGLPVATAAAAIVRALNEGAREVTLETPKTPRFAGSSRDGSDGTRTRDLRRDRPAL